MFGINFSVTTSVAIMTVIMSVYGAGVDVTAKRQTGVGGQVLACTEPGFTGYCATVTTPQNRCILVADPLLIGNISSVLPGRFGNGQDCFYTIGSCSSDLFLISSGGIANLASVFNDNKPTGFQ
ncbi:hypothetical protein DFH09DRAFT_1136375 [Mycena vulgaris]|nr:hypothetical protein DFH09DRAFT_1136375 [Mycena vulgaris]